MEITSGFSGGSAGSRRGIFPSCAGGSSSPARRSRTSACTTPSSAATRRWRFPTDHFMTWINADDILVPGALAFVATVYRQFEFAPGVLARRRGVPDPRLLDARVLRPHHPDRSGPPRHVRQPALGFRPAGGDVLPQMAVGLDRREKQHPHHEGRRRLEHLAADGAQGLARPDNVPAGLLHDPRRPALGQVPQYLHGRDERARAGGDPPRCACRDRQAGLCRAAPVQVTIRRRPVEHPRRV